MADASMRNNSVTGMMNAGMAVTRIGTAPQGPALLMSSSVEMAYVMTKIGSVMEREIALMAVTRMAAQQQPQPRLRLPPPPQPQPPAQLPRLLQRQDAAIWIEILLITMRTMECPYSHVEMATVFQNRLSVTCLMTVGTAVMRIELLLVHVEGHTTLQMESSNHLHTQIDILTMLIVYTLYPSRLEHS